MKKVFEKAKEFIYRNARPLDFARFAYHFENGSLHAVLDALAFYQNEDGGFGHALEADSWNPNSTPSQTWYATEILREIGFTDASHPIMQGILNYLASGKDFDGHLWYIAVKSNNDYPHAPWWQTEKDTTGINPSACLAGFLLRYAQKDSALYTRGVQLAKEMYADFMKSEQQNDMHTLSCFLRLLEYTCEAGGQAVFDTAAMEAKLKTLIHSAITQDTRLWEISYVCKPSQFINSPESIFYPENREIAHFECEHIRKTQLDNGAWMIPWRWNDYPDEWALSRNFWQADVIIRNLLYLKAFGELQ